MRQLIAAAVAALALTGCSQVAALTPVGGTAITSVRNATYQVLVQQQVPILVAPQCESATEGFTCVGSTVDGSTIRTTASATAPYEMTITVGDEVVFRGTAQAVLDAAVLEGS